MSRSFRTAVAVIAIIQAVFGVLFALQVQAITALWPLPGTSPLSLTLIGSFFAAAAASTLWCIYAREDGAMRGVALDYIVIFAPLSVYLFQISGREPTAIFAVAFALGALFGIGLFAVNARVPIRDSRAMPRPVYLAFVIFIAALVLAGGAMVTNAMPVLPWTVTADGSVVYGWMFLGAAAYFAYGLLRPSWHNAAGQLAGFLAYDLVLIVPFLNRLSTVTPEFQINLIVYLTVVISSGALSIFYLFINPTTRIFRMNAR